LHFVIERGEIKTTVAKIDKLRTDIDAIIEVIEG
jgi:ribosomal protein L17